MDWRRISPAMAGEEPVFVVGVYRSGTSALRTTLHRVPAFHAPDARSPETRVFRHPDRIERIFERPQRRMLRYLRGDEIVAQELVHTLGEVRPAFAPLRRWLHDRSRDRARRWRLLGHHHRLRVYFHYAQHARGSARILE